MNDFETLEEERDRLLDENADLRRIVDLARRVVKNIDDGYPKSLELDALRSALATDSSSPGKEGA
jgi:hypothetical protein